MVHSVVETPSYLRAAKEAGMTEAEMLAAVQLVAEVPDAGAVMVGTGGARKLRLALLWQILTVRRADTSSAVGAL